MPNIDKMTNLRKCQNVVFSNIFAQTPPAKWYFKAINQAGTFKGTIKKCTDPGGENGLKCTFRPGN